MRSSAADSVAFACILGFTTGVVELRERLRRGELLCRLWKAVVKGEINEDRSIGSFLVLRGGAHPSPQRRKDARPRRGDPQPGRGLAVSG